MGNTHALGIDLGKTMFQVGLDSNGRVVVRKRCSRTQLLAFTANVQVQLIGMEAWTDSPPFGHQQKGYCQGDASAFVFALQPAFRA